MKNRQNARERKWVEQEKEYYGTSSSLFKKGCYNQECVHLVMFTVHVFLPNISCCSPEHQYCANVSLTWYLSHNSKLSRSRIWRSVGWYQKSRFAKKIRQYASYKSTWSFILRGVLISRPSQSMNLENCIFPLRPGIYAQTSFLFQKGGTIHCWKDAKLWNLFPFVAVSLLWRSRCKTNVLFSIMRLL